MEATLFLSPEDALKKWGALGSARKRSQSIQQIARRSTERNSTKNSQDSMPRYGGGSPGRPADSFKKAYGISKADLRRAVAGKPEVVVKIARSCMEKKGIKDYFKYLSLSLIHI